MRTFDLGELVYCPFRDTAHRGVSPREAGLCEGPNCMCFEFDVEDVSGHCGLVSKSTVDAGGGE